MKSNIEIWRLVEGNDILGKVKVLSLFSLVVLYVVVHNISKEQEQMPVLL